MIGEHRRPAKAKAKLFSDGTLKLTLQGRRRARLVKLVPGEFLSAEVEPVASEGDQAAESLAKEALEVFARYKNIDLSAPPQAMMGLS